MSRRSNTDFNLENISKAVLAPRGFQNYTKIVIEEDRLKDSEAEEYLQFALLGDSIKWLITGSMLACATYEALSHYGLI